MAPEDYNRLGQMKMVMHMIYEFKKGVRSLALCTLCPTCARIVQERLDNQGIAYIVQSVGQRKVNLFFGQRECLDVVASLAHKPLNTLTPEEDFMLGAMLGYDIRQQSLRFCQRKFGKTGPVS